MGFIQINKPLFFEETPELTLYLYGVYNKWFII